MAWICAKSLQQSLRSTQLTTTQTMCYMQNPMKYNWRSLMQNQSWDAIDVIYKLQRWRLPSSCLLLLTHKAVLHRAKANPSSICQSAFIALELLGLQIGMCLLNSLGDSKTQNSSILKSKISNNIKQRWKKTLPISLWTSINLYNS